VLGGFRRFMVVFIGPYSFSVLEDIQGISRS
jgi:hypothetical protein